MILGLVLNPFNSDIYEYIDCRGIVWHLRIWDEHRNVHTARAVVDGITSVCKKSEEHLRLMVSTPM